MPNFMPVELPLRRRYAAPIVTVIVIVIAVVYHWSVWAALVSERERTQDLQEVVEFRDCISHVTDLMLEVNEDTVVSTSAPEIATVCDALVSND